jgi:hypothetical protein
LLGRGAIRWCLGSLGWHGANTKGKDETEHQDQVHQKVTLIGGGKNASPSGRLMPMAHDGTLFLLA